MNVAVVLAGGIGSRVGGDVPKQFLELEGRAVIEYSVDAFEQSEGIDEIALVIHPDWMDHMRVILRRNPWRKVRRLLPGGKERHLSSLHAIEAYAGESGITISSSLPTLSGSVRCVSSMLNPALFIALNIVSICQRRL